VEEVWGCEASEETAQLRLRWYYCQEKWVNIFHISGDSWDTKTPVKVSRKKKKNWSGAQKTDRKDQSASDSGIVVIFCQENDPQTITTEVVECIPRTRNKEMNVLPDNTEIITYSK
ncbi:hypothetical protein CEXT_346131, partial [Caerostris extrusa]